MGCNNIITNVKVKAIVTVKKKKYNKNNRLHANVSVVLTFAVFYKELPCNYLLIAGRSRCAALEILRGI